MDFCIFTKFCLCFLPVYLVTICFLMSIKRQSTLVNDLLLF